MPHVPPELAIVCTWHTEPQYMPHSLHSYVEVILINSLKHIYGLCGEICCNLFA